MTNPTNDAAAEPSSALPSDPGGVARIAKELYRGASRGGRIVQSLRPYICPFDQLLPLVPPGSTVLDVGCGSGLLLGLLAHSGRIRRGIGFDSSRPAIGTAEAMKASLPDGAREAIVFERLDVNQEWPQGEFDVVAMVDVMHHVPPPAQPMLMRTAATKVAPGGLLIYKDMSRFPRWMALANRMHDLVMARQWIHYAPLSEARTWGIDAGLLLREEGAARMLWYSHEWLVFQRPSTP